ncbi:hypothetical protein AMATHDRAFT_57 [Amanita thiersii Skay4041]|uniref:Co-chaperone HscB C-terminal oligomerisation domain-containing protein n=1 Tax=Amanita thiersii Skay4041 TaxID=703135 RepID=A0A2A9NVB0_9AGAR|nr:hypothetical protein AMATHDRAFT_57 [Amanita thiersii Skay4041]
MFTLFSRLASPRLRLASRSLHFSSPNPTRLCPSCNSKLPSPLPACTVCWNISPLPSDTPYHHLFDLPYDPNPFSVNIPLLKQRFRAAQAVCHPDAWASKGDNKQEVAQALSARLNGAYQGLLNPLSRAEYLLEQNHLPMSEHDQINDMGFMSYIMEARETIEEAEDKDQVACLADKNEVHIKETISETERLVGEEDWKGVKEVAIRLRYLEGIRRAAKEWMDNKL